MLATREGICRTLKSLCCCMLRTESSIASIKCMLETHPNNQVSNSNAQLFLKSEMVTPKHKFPFAQRQEYIFIVKDHMMYQLNLMNGETLSKETLLNWLSSERMAKEALLVLSVAVSVDSWNMVDHWWQRFPLGFSCSTNNCCLVTNLFLKVALQNVPRVVTLFFFLLQLFMLNHGWACFH